MTDPWYVSIAELGRAYRSRELSPVEVTQAILDRIDHLDGRLGSYNTVTGATAMEAARASERRFARSAALGPLDGAPVGFKDIFDTAGVLTTGNSALYADNVPTQNAPAVARLIASGAISLGKHATYELALTREPESAFPLPRNPWDLARAPAGSSSGSAVALAAGLCAGALGTDSGGSIRLPASLCGVVGMRPTFGLVSRTGAIPGGGRWTWGTTGPMARTVEDVALLLQAVAGYDPSDPVSVDVEVPDYSRELVGGISGWRVGVPLAYVESIEDTQPEVLQAYRTALGTLERLGATVQETSMPLELQHMTAVFWTILLVESLAAQERNMRERPGQFGRALYARMLEAALLSGTDYVQALRGRTLIRRAMEEMMREVDVLALPTIPQRAWPIADDDLPRNRVPFTQPFSVAGQPAITVTCGFSKDGMPIGLQISGRAFNDHAVLATAHAYERATEWSKRRPMLESVGA